MDHFESSLVHRFRTDNREIERRQLNQGQDARRYFNRSPIKGNYHAKEKEEKKNKKERYELYTKLHPILCACIALFLLSRYINVYV